MESRSAMAGLPIACSLAPAELGARAAEFLPGLGQRAAEIAPLGDGVSLRFEPGADVLDAVARTIDRERQCCPFLEFRLTVEPNHGGDVARGHRPAGHRRAAGHPGPWRAPR